MCTYLHVLYLVVHASFLVLVLCAWPYSALKRSSAALAVMARGEKDLVRDRGRAHTAAAGLQLLSRQLARKLYGGGGRGREQELAATARDIQSTKQQVLKILYELLKEPDFRAHLLKKGVEAAEAAMRKAQEDLRKAEEKLTADSKHADDKVSEERNEAMNRQTTKGAAFVTTEQYKMEHAAFLKEYGPLMREIFILETLKGKIISYCLTGVWERGGFQYESAAQKAAVERERILKQMREGQRGLERLYNGGGGL